MLTQKIFHVCQSLTETQKRLLEVGNNLGNLEGVVLSAQADEPAHLELLTGSGFHADLRLEQLDSGDANQILFRSVDGNLQLTGLLELFPIREDLTEVQLTLDYTLSASLPIIVDTAINSLDRFVNRQLRTVKSWVATGVLAPRVSRQRRLRSRMGTVRQWQLAQ